MSVFHVLRQKNCYPQGCIQFLWRCHLLNKGKRCTRGFKHVGRKCFGCREFFDIKIHSQPVLLITEAEYEKFLEQLGEFEDWLEQLHDRNIDIQGRIASVKPALTKIITHRSERLELKGYLLHFNESFIDRSHWEDHCYAVIYPDQQQRFNFAAGDELDFRARVTLDQGRLVFKKLNSIDFSFRSNRPAWSNSEALVIQHTLIPFDRQPQKCYHCDQGMLVDVIDRTKPQLERRRQLFCLKNYADPNDCIYSTETTQIEETQFCPQ
ncbi:MAG: hypothetical protein ACOY90_04165 [Candidatus Zhuqueibacterota bacterium]